ncbi:MAG: hypothetical protein ABSF83_08370 [Nitrososphaerales archaeon]
MINAPKKSTVPKVEVFSSKIPRPEDVPLVPIPILRASSKILEGLKDTVHAKWAVGGDAGAVMAGVNVTPEYIEILTTKEGCDEISRALARYQTLAPAMVERKLPREAEIDGKMLPVYIRSHYAELSVDGVKVEVHGDKQIKVGEWEWGDPLDYTADYTYISGGRLPLVPLSLMSELDLGLGWLDHVKLISDAVMMKFHNH